MPREKKSETPESPKPADDPFLKKIQEVLDRLMDSQEGKELNAVITNAIRFLALKHKIVNNEDEGSVWDD